MSSHAAMSMFIVGRHEFIDNTTPSPSNRFINRVKLYFLWAMLGVFAVFTIFNSSSQQQIKHLVVFKYKPGTSARQIDEASSAFESLQYKIPGIVKFEHDNNFYEASLDQGFSHVYLITFKNAAARDAYFPHPDHARFGQLLKELKVVEDAFIVDFMERKN